MATKNSESNDGLLGFLKASPTPFHATEQIQSQLEKEGYQILSEADAWKLEKDGKYCVTRNGSSIVAFRLGDSPAETGFRITGAHTDSPCLRLRPEPMLFDRAYTRFSVEIYGGPLLFTWFDRDLSLAGRVFYRGKKGETKHCLVNLERPIATVPSLAIHLNRSVHENRSLNRQSELPPITAMKTGEDTFQDMLLSAVSAASSDSPDAIVSHELYFYDTQPAAIVGLNNEFVVGARLDNLLSCFIGMRSLVQASGKATSVLVCNDHEEVGSVSDPGANGTFLRSVLERIAGTGESFARAMAKSMLVSTDNAHGIHPNYPEKHDANHAPLLNQGPVIKTNTNQRYATSSETAARFIDCCEKADVPFQNFAARNDMGCGSTIGPITASVLGVRALDVGVPTFGMHSIRELAGTQDAQLLVRALTEFYRHPGWD